MTTLFLWLLLIHLLLWFVLLRKLFWKNYHELRPLSPSQQAQIKNPPKVTVLIPARNEEKSIQKSIISLLRQDYKNLQIIVINDRSDDHTGDILSRLQKRFPKQLSVVQGFDPPMGWMGKCHALYIGYQSVDPNSEWLVFSDADIVHHPATIRRAVYQAEKNKANLLTMFPTVRYVGFWEHVILGVFTHLGISSLKVAKIHDQDNKRFAGIGAFTMVERASYDAWGGHEAIKGEVIDDMALGMKVKESGGSILFTKDFGAVSLRMYDSLKSITDGFLKNVQTGIGGGVFRSISACVAFFALHMVPLITLIYSLLHLPTLSGVILFLVSLFLYLATGISLENRISRLIYFKPGRIAIGYPLGVLLCVWIILKSMWFSHVKKEIRWRGRSIPKPKQQVKMFK